MAINVFDIFTKTERKVLQLSIKAFSNQQIADALFISKRTVERHKANIATKMGINGSCEMRQFLLEITPLLASISEKE
jgi:two-component system, NarL family, response regulator NreC